MATPWTSERTAMLRELWRDGLPGGVIAKRLGMTRGMVAGKRHSLGLAPRLGEVAKQAERANGRRTASLCGHVGKADGPAQRAMAANVAAALDRMNRPLAGSNPKPWELRRPGECAFPVDGLGGATWSCCGPVEPGSGYCHGHREMLAGRPWPPEDAPADLAAARWEPACADG